ncbi:uncharacterized protein FA14DRAFT_9662 [Meira miltonrushii]|uniref:Uncharacterized protein n=1 Tax=Meira miltonrushii TaxID=1280837 RepID=A0A316VHK0_9BASI|nr:uncharacterized protein FA14DRAFT_9662 [Meira miltonrushii]PWN37072.1 hypothetical protein FA14DRAFT_9662 [Meira miltonrushii]
MAIQGTGTSKEGQTHNSSALLNRSLAADTPSRHSTDGSSNQHATSSGGGGNSGSSSNMQHQQDSLGHTQGSNQSPGTFGRHASRNGSIHSQSNENLPSPILDGSAYRRDTDSATPIAGMYNNPTVLPSALKGKQRAKDDSNNSRTSIDSSRRSSVRWSGELPRLDEDMDDDMFTNAIQNKFQTPLSPRIQAAVPIAISADQERKRRSFELSPRFQAQDRIAKQSNPSLGQLRDLSPDSELATGGRSKGYRRIEREVESQQERLRLEGGGTLSPVSSSASPPLFALGEGRMQAESSNAQAKRAKRVSLGQVSIDGVPVAIGSPIFGRGNSPTRHFRTDSKDPKLSPVHSRSKKRSSYGHRRLALSESSRTGSKERKRVRKRTSSDPIVKADDPDFMSDRRRSEEGGRIFRSLLEGGRARKRSETEGITAISQTTLSPSTAVGQKKAFSEEYLGPFPSQSSTRLPIGTSAESRMALARNSSSMMRWDSAHATALSLRQGDHYGYDSRQNDYIGGRISTTSTLMHNRSLARYHLGALISLRCRIPHHSSKSLEPLQFRSIVARIHHSLLMFQIYLHVPATIFFDYNALYTLVQVALYPDTDDQSAAWWIASGIYAGCFAIWLIGVLVIWEIVIQFKRRWINDRPFALPIYLSSHAFNLSSVRSFSLYSLLYRTRLQASKRDFLIETCWFFSQNWPTVLTILPRGIILTILLVIYNPTSNGNRIPLNGQMRDPVYFNSSSGLLTNFSYVILLINTIWIAWRILLLLTAWIGLLFAVGPRSLISRERSAYKDEGAEISLTDLRLSTSTRPLLNASRASNIRGNESRQETHHPAQYRNEEPVQANDEMQQVSTIVTRPTLGSVEIPRRSHSLVRGAQRPIQTSQATEEHVQSNKEPRPDTFSGRKTILPPWAWRARAEERLSALILECRLDDEIVTPEEEINAWGDPLPGHAGQGRAKEQELAAYGPQNVYESKMAEVPILFLPEDDANAIAENQAVKNSPTHLSTLEGTYASTSDRLLTTNNLPQPGLGQVHADKSVSSVDIGRSDAYPFPCQNEEQSSQPTIRNPSKASDLPIIVPTAVPVERTHSPSASLSSNAQNVASDGKRLSNTNPYISGQASKSSKRSLTGKAGVHSSSNSTSSLGESIRTALGRRSTETTNGTENGGRNEALRSQTNLQTSPKMAGAATSWWKGLFGGVSSSAPEVSDANVLAAANAQPDDQLVEETDDAVVYPRTSSPLSGIRTAGQENHDEDVSRSVETSNATSNVEDSGEIASERIANAQRSRTNDEDAASLRSTSTDDSEERRIWSQFPEQSRRHPPGLIALELEQRKLAADKRLRSSTNVSQSGSQSTIVAPVTSTSNATDSVAILPAQDTEHPDSSFEGDSSFGSATHMLPSTQLEALGPIQEESWSNSHEAITDEEMELMHSEQNSALRR